MSGQGLKRKNCTDLTHKNKRSKGNTFTIIDETVNLASNKHDEVSNLSMMMYSSDD